MKHRNLLFAIAAAALIVLSSTSTWAQPSGASEWKKRVFEQVTSGASRQPVENVEPASTAIELLAPSRDGLGDILARQKNALIGAWDLTLIFSDGSQAKSTLSIFPGRADGEGLALHAAEASLLLPNPTTPEQGAWQHNGGAQFIASYRGYAVDEKFEHPFGRIGFRHAITLNTDQQTFTGMAVFEVIDAEGKVVFSDNVQTRGVRQRAVAP
jgi:hypothetical protein